MRLRPWQPVPADCLSLDDALAAVRQAARLTMRRSAGCQGGIPMMPGSPWTGESLSWALHLFGVQGSSGSCDEFRISFERMIAYDTYDPTSSDTGLPQMLHTWIIGEQGMEA